MITELTESGDTHGWHWDDYSFALVWVIDCPAPEFGGLVQCVPNTVWDKDSCTGCTRSRVAVASS